MSVNKNIYAVIFRAQLAQPDEEYDQTAERLQDLARQDYGCIDFISLTSGYNEVSISYWEDLEHIQTWKTNAEHLLAQKTGKSKWFSSYQIQVVEVIRDYRHDVELHDSN